MKRAARLTTTALVVVGAILAPGERMPRAAQAPATAAAHGHFTNRLAGSGSPYLLLHADNPVDWYPWGPEAIEKARREDKPIFLSVGYSTCFWCHVAERTIYSDPAIAKLMNQWFVNVKVDREQRPDIDQIYMLATRIMTGRGGWPNNVFMTPDLQPFYAGSYFPPADDATRGPGFPTILRALHEAWTNERAEVRQTAANAADAMRRVRQQMAASAAAPIEPATWMRTARESLIGQFDSEHGGIGSGGGPKFPRSPDLALLLSDFRLHGNEAARLAVTTTLDAMAYGGVHDHLAGGFHRYSTERTWWERGRTIHCESITRNLGGRKSRARCTRAKTLDRFHCRSAPSRVERPGGSRLADANVRADRRHGTEPAALKVFDCLQHPAECSMTAASGPGPGGFQARRPPCI